VSTRKPLRITPQRDSNHPAVEIVKQYLGYCPCCDGPPNRLVQIIPSYVIVKDGNFKSPELIQEVCLDCGSVIREFYDEDYLERLNSLVGEANEYNNYISSQQEVQHDLDTISGSP